MPVEKNLTPSLYLADWTFRHVLKPNTPTAVGSVLKLVISKHTVRAKTWMKAREEAAIVLGAEPGQLELIERKDIVK